MGEVLTAPHPRQTPGSGAGVTQTSGQRTRILAWGAQSLTCTWGGVSPSDTRVRLGGKHSCRVGQPRPWDGCPLLGWLRLAGPCLVPNRSRMDKQTNLHIFSYYLAVVYCLKKGVFTYFNMDRRIEDSEGSKGQTVMIN